MRTEFGGVPIRLMAAAMLLSTAAVSCTGSDEPTSWAAGSSREMPIRIGYLETQSWPHKGKAAGGVVVVVPKRTTVVEVRLIDRASRAITKSGASAVHPSTCYLTEVASGSVLFEAQGDVVIGRGPVTDDNDGPKIDALYEVEVVYTDASGDRHTAIAQFDGLCSVATA